MLMIDRVDWKKPPPKFDKWDNNPLVYAAPVAEKDDKTDNVVIQDEVMQPDTSTKKSWDELNKLWDN